MILDDGKFELIETKIADIQGKIDQGLADPGVNGARATEALRGARAELFKLRGIVRDCIEIEPTRGPDTPRAA